MNEMKVSVDPADDDTGMLRWRTSRKAEYGNITYRDVRWVNRSKMSTEFSDHYIGVTQTDPIG
jgi:hypothetical protein